MGYGFSVVQHDLGVLPFIANLLLFDHPLILVHPSNDFELYSVARVQLHPPVKKVGSKIIFLSLGIKSELLLPTFFTGGCS